MTACCVEAVTRNQRPLQPNACHNNLSHHVGIFRGLCWALLQDKTWTSKANQIYGVELKLLQDHL